MASQRREPEADLPWRTALGCSSGRVGGSSKLPRVVLSESAGLFSCDTPCDMRRFPSRRRGADAASGLWRDGSVAWPVL